MNSVKIAALVCLCALVQQSFAGIAEENWKKDGDRIRETLKASIRKSLEEIPDSSRLSQTKKTEITSFLTTWIFNHIDKELNKFEHKYDNLATLRKQLLKDGAKLLMLRARWPLHQVEAAVENLVNDYKKKVESVGIVDFDHDSRMSALDLEHIIQEILVTLLQDPSAVSLIQFLGTIPASLHRIADALFTNKTFPEIFEMLGLGNEDSGNAETILAPLAEAISKPKIDNSAVMDKLSFIIHSAVKSVDPEIEAVRATILARDEELGKLDSELRNEMRIYNKELWEQIKKAAENLSIY